MLKTHYARVGDGPVAYLDETYHLEADGRTRFYVMAAVVVLACDRDALRDELDAQVPDGWWHTTENLRDDAGRQRTRALLRAFQVPDETCVVVHQATVESLDKDGSGARRAVLGRLLAAVHTAEHSAHPRVDLVVLEEQREARKNNFDRMIRSDLLKREVISPSMEMVLASPGSEHLLWLPDLVCSAYRRSIVNKDPGFFSEVADKTHVIEI